MEAQDQVGSPLNFVASWMDPPVTRPALAVLQGPHGRPL